VFEKLEDGFVDLPSLLVSKYLKIFEANEQIPRKKNELGPLRILFTLF